MSKKKKKISSKKKPCSLEKCNKNQCVKNCGKEKAFGDPSPVRPVGEYYNLQTGEIYPKIFFKESWWTKLKRFFGLVP
jgi:hypothetical protein